MLNDLEVATLAAEAGAEIARSAFNSTYVTEFKGEVNPVTAIDHAAEAAVFAVLAEHRPNDGVLAEESGGVSWEKGRVWIVDPIDGTVNFLHGFPHSSVSVGLWEDGSPIAGTIVDISHNEVFSATREGGAYLNGCPIHSSGISVPIRALVCTGFPYDRNERAEDYLPAIGALLRNFQGVRRLGSAALDLAWIACGRLDGYFEYLLHPWDAAAGLLIATEAGALVSDLQGRPYRLDSKGIVAATPGIHEALVSAISPEIPARLRD